MNEAARAGAGREGQQPTPTTASMVGIKPSESQTQNLESHPSDQQIGSSASAQAQAAAGGARDKSAERRHPLVASNAAQALTTSAPQKDA